MIASSSLQETYCTPSSFSLFRHFRLQFSFVPPVPSCSRYEISWMPCFFRVLNQSNGRWSNPRCQSARGSDSNYPAGLFFRFNKIGASNFFSAVFEDHSPAHRYPVMSDYLCTPVEQDLWVRWNNPINQDRHARVISEIVHPTGQFPGNDIDVLAIPIIPHRYDKWRTICLNTSYFCDVGAREKSVGLSFRHAWQLLLMPAARSRSCLLKHSFDTCS